MEENKKMGYYSGNTNILQTLVDCSIDSLMILGKCTWNFTKWCFDGWIDFNKPSFEILWEETKLYNSNKKNKPILKKEKHSDKNDVYIFTVPTGLAVIDFIKKKEQIAQFLHTDLQHIKIENINNLAVITVYKEGKIEYFYEDYQFPVTKDIKIPIGINLDNWQIVFWEPNDPNTCHLLMAGNTGAGKSTIISVILYYLTANRNDVKIYLQDVKKVDLPFFKNAEQVVEYNIGKDCAEETAATLVDEMNRRYDYLVEKGVRNMNELNPKDRLESIFYIIEELAIFKYGNGKGPDADLFENLRILLEQGRAANITIICITQSPYADTLPGQWKANFPAIVGLKTRTPEASKVICGDYDLLTNLRGKGHGYFFTPEADIEFQGFNIKLETIKEIAKKNKKEGKKNEN